jgi:hypothetical protein
MNTFTTVTLLVSAAYLILGLALIMNTTNLRSAIMFKVIPFILGCALLYVAAYQNGMVGAPGTPGVETTSEWTPAQAEALAHRELRKRLGIFGSIPSGRPQRVPCVGRLTVERSPHCMLAIATRRVPSNTSTALLAPMSGRTAPIRTHA